MDDVGGLEEGVVGSEEPVEEDNADVTQLLVDTHTLNGTPLKSSLRFPVERVLENAMTRSTYVLRLSRSS